MSDNIQKMGAYTPYSCEINKESKLAFEEAFKGFVGVKYTPVAVSHQIVAGINYHFFCNTQSVTASPSYGVAIVSIYKPLKDGAHITNIKSIN